MSRATIFARFVNKLAQASQATCEPNGLDFSNLNIEDRAIKVEPS
jgi:hypothetical protein